MPAALQLPQPQLPPAHVPPPQLPPAHPPQPQLTPAQLHASLPQHEMPLAAVPRLQMPLPVPHTPPPSLPPPWVQHIDAGSGRAYFANPNTGEAYWARLLVEIT